jgi:hypothetical protein
MPDTRPIAPQNPPPQSSPVPLPQSEVRATPIPSKLGACSVGRRRLPARPAEEMPSANQRMSYATAVAWGVYLEACDDIRLETAAALAKSEACQAIAVAERNGSTDESAKTAAWMDRNKEERKLRHLSSLEADDRLSEQAQSRARIAARRAQWGHGRQATIPAQGGHWRAALGPASSPAASYPACSPAQSGGAVSRPMAHESVESVARAGRMANPNAAEKQQEFALVQNSAGRYSPNRQAPKGLRSAESLGSRPVLRQGPESRGLSPKAKKAKAGRRQPEVITGGHLPPRKQAPKRAPAVKPKQQKQFTPSPVKPARRECILRSIERSG